MASNLKDIYLSVPYFLVITCLSNEYLSAIFAEYPYRRLVFTVFLDLSLLLGC